MKEKKLAIVTGATGAIGKAIVSGLLKTQEFRVIMLVRNKSKAEKVMDEFIRFAGPDLVSYVLVDLSDKKEIYDFAASIREPLHVLVNNAADTPRRRTETARGIEMQFAVNVLGYFWMMDAFTKHLRAGAPSRIVNVASYWAGGLNMDDPEFRVRHYDNDSAYRQSKQADRMLSAAFARRLQPFEISVNSCHPGDVNSALSNSMGFGGHETPAQGADTPVWLATSPDVEGITGKYFEHRRRQECSFSGNLDEVDRLFEICERYFEP